MSAAYLNIKKLKGVTIVQTAARHNLREIQAELGADSHIDSVKSCRNLRLAGPATAAAVAEVADNAMQDAGIVKLRKDAVRSVEVCISLPVGARVNIDGFFADSLAWVRDYFDVPVLSAVVHMDEAAPHLHVLLLPLRNSRMVGSDLVGNITRLQGMQSGFFNAVAARHGLTKPKTENRLSSTARDKAARLVLNYIKSHPECLQRPDVCLVLIQLVSANPKQLMAALGLEMQTSKTKKQKTFVEIMTKPCKPEPKQKPIGFAKQGRPRNSEPYHCVGFASSPLSAVTENQTNAGDIVRLHDTDQCGVLDEVMGEWRLLPIKQQGRVRLCSEKC